MSSASRASPAARRLAASRRARLCDQEGLEPALRIAQDEGEAMEFDDVEDYLEAVLEGEVEDVLGKCGWRPCGRPGRCRRAGRCLRPRDPDRAVHGMPAPLCGE